jgi:release factor glutamine methyltransferase
MLAAQLDAERPGPETSVLDLCTGSGILAIRAACRGAGRVVAVDVSRRAVVAVALNSRLNGVRVTARRGDLYSPVAGERFDLITANPPYLPSPDPGLPRRGLARATEAGPRGRAFIDRICAAAPEHLRPGGRVLIVHSSLCGEDETLARLAAVGLEAQVAARYPGPLGPRLSARADWMRAQGLLQGEPREDIVIVRGRHPKDALADSVAPPARDLQTTN